MEEENIEQEIAKKDFNGEDIEIGNLQYLNILDIVKNEHYGIVYMLLKKPAPLSLRVKSKYSQLFLLRKNDTMQISKAYPNVWKKIYFKSYHNMKSIKRMTRKVIINYCENYGHKINIENSGSLNDGKKDTDFFINLGILNSHTRKNTKKTMFNLDSNHNSNKNLVNPKPILKHGKNEILGLNKNHTKNFYGYQSFGFNSGLKSQLNTNITLNQGKSNTNVNLRKMSIFSSRNKLSNLGNDERDTRINQINQINQINNNINYNIVINDVDMNNDSKTLLKSEENKKNTLMKNSIRNSLKKSNFMQNVPSKIKGLTNLKSNTIHINPENLNLQSTQNFDRFVTLNMANANEDISRNNTLQMNEEDNKSEQSIKTINNLSKSLLKKVKKKMKKRHKRKKMYKLLIQKITESLAKINPNVNLSSSMNNNSILLSSKIGDATPINPELNYIIDEKPELNLNINQNMNNQNLPQKLNGNINLNQYNINQNPFQIPQHHEIFPVPNPQDLFLIPESLEITSSDSSSDNSSESNKSSKKEDENKNSKNNRSKLNETPPKKVIELSISESTNFSLNSSYENLNKLSKGNYIKDENLQKSVIKLINVYLTEKEKPQVDLDKRPKNATSIIERKSSLGKSPKLKDPEKKKEKNKEKDVWFYLEEDQESNNSKKQDSFEKGCKSPQMRHRKTNDFSRKKKAKRIYDNLFSLDETPKKRKTMNKRKRSINKTTLRRDTKKKKINEDDDNDNKIDKEKSKDKIKDDEKDKNKNTTSSLEFSDIEDPNEQRDTYVNNYYKTYQKKNKKIEKNKDSKSGDYSSDNNKDSND